MENKLIVLNHKMSLEYDEVHLYIDRLNKIDTKYNLIVIPSFIYSIDFINHCNWGVGAQNVSQYDGGNYTGEISSLQLKSLGIEYVLVGHYERRKYFHETDEDVHEKLIACLESNIMPILCFDNVKSLDIYLKDIENIDFIIFAYEPLIHKVDDIEGDIGIIYDYLYDKYHSKPNIIYGGGVKKEDVPSLLKIDKLNGLMFGKVSADISKIEKIINCCYEK